MNAAIIVPAYSRPRAFARLLESLENAEIRGATVILSLDGGCHGEIPRLADAFASRNSECEIVTHKANRGLKEHILWCGDLAYKYGAVIILEEDLYVDPQFYRYACAALQFSEKHDRIAGVALYGQRYNEYAMLPFEPRFDGRTAYYMMVACSWGQCWTEKQWDRFRVWYAESVSADVENCVRLPKKVRRWSEQSWKKYFSAFLVEEEKYFLYPYHTYVTNCADAGGVHMPYGTHAYQVPMQNIFRSPDSFDFPSFDDSCTRYDSFFEPEAKVLAESLGVHPSEVEIDLYGTKPLELLRQKPFVLTSRRLRNPITAFKLRFRPIENTVLEQAEGSSGEWDESVFFGRSTQVREQAQPYFKLARYFSYVPLHTRRFAEGYLRYVVKDSWRTFFR